MKKVVLFLFGVMLIISPVFAAEQKVTKQKDTVSLNSTKEPKKKKEKYTTKPFDITADKLPPNYAGHDAKQLYQNIQQRKSREKKGEFETSEQFQKRVEKESTAPILGSLGTDNYFVFQPMKIDSQYDADKKVLSVPFDFALGLLDKDKTRKVIDIKSEVVKVGTYTATNAFGALINVEEMIYRKYLLAISNYSIFSIENYTDARLKDLFAKYSNDTPSSPVTKYPSITLSSQIGEAIIARFIMSPEEALSAKKNMRVILICKIEAPFISADSSYSKPTFDKPTGWLSEEQYIYASLYEIWFYEYSTGKVFTKINKTAIEAERERMILERYHLRVKYMKANDIVKAVYMDLYGMTVQDSSDPAQSFIDLLESTSLYDMLYKKGKISSLSEDLKVLIQETQAYRDKSYQRLSKEQKDNILKINRKTLKAVYPESYPDETDEQILLRFLFISSE